MSYSDDEYGDEHVDMYINDPYDLDDPVCQACGSTHWEYCTIGEDNKIKKCSECPKKEQIH